MTRRRRSSSRTLVALAAVVAALAVALSASTAVAAPHPSIPTAPAHPTVDPAEAGCDAVPGKLLVRFTSRATGSAKAAARAAVHGRALHSYRLVPGLELVSTDLPVGGALRVLHGNRSITAAQPDCRVQATKVPNDEFFASKQWGLRNTGGATQDPPGGIAGKDIDAAAGWDIRTDASSVPVAIIDTGMELNHEDLAANLWTNPGEIAGNGIDDDGNGFVDDVHGWDFVRDDAVPNDENGHGTHVAGIIGARGNNGKGVAGVAWTASLMPLKVLDQNGTGADSDIIAALEYAADNGAKVTNNSYGGSGDDPDLFAAFVAAGAAGMLQVVAAGNDGEDNDTLPHSPASFRLDSVISVAATDNTDALADFSDFGATSVDVAAPGVDVASTFLETVPPFAKYVFDSGTSMATPMVTGVAALVAAQNPSWTAQQVRARILATTRPDAALSGKTVTGGVVDLRRALFVPRLTLDPTSDSGSSTTDRLTNASALKFNITFPLPVTGLASGDLTVGGTATGCHVDAPTGSGASYQVPVTACSPGTVTLTIASGGVLDASSTPEPPTAVGSSTVTIDRAGPSVSGLAVSPLTGVDLSGTSLRLHLAWAAADTGGAGVDHDEAQVSVDGGTTWTNVSTALPTPVANVLAATSGTVRYRVRAVDKAGNPGPFSPATLVTPRLTQNTSSSVVFSSGWSPSTSTSFSGGSARFATVAVKTATFAFTGRSIALVTTRAATRGQVKIFIDGVFQATVDLSGSTTFKFVAWQKTFATSARRTVRLAVVGTSGRPRIDMDAFAVVS